MKLRDPICARHHWRRGQFILVNAHNRRDGSCESYLGSKLVPLRIQEDKSTWRHQLLQHPSTGEPSARRKALCVGANLVFLDVCEVNIAYRRVIIPVEHGVYGLR